MAKKIQAVRGKNVIRSQEELLKMAEKYAHINDIISEVKALISNSVNSGISDFPSAFGNTKENNQRLAQKSDSQYQNTDRVIWNTGV